MALKKIAYRRVFIVQSRDWFSSLERDYNPATDLVLTFDFGLCRMITELGGEGQYLDHLLDAETMQANNYLTYEYFKCWHLDENGEDLVTYRGIPFGFALRTDIWNDLLSYVRFRLCLSVLSRTTYSRLIFASDIPLLVKAVKATCLQFEIVSAPVEQRYASYYFPVFRWMDERVRNRHLKAHLREFVTAFLGTCRSLVDRLPRGRQCVSVYIQEYHPTRGVARCLRENDQVRVVQGHYRAAAGWPGLLKDHVIPIWPVGWRFAGESERLLGAVELRAVNELFLSDGTDITAEVRALIVARLRPRLAHALNELHWIIAYLKRQPCSLVVLVGNIGPVAAMVHRVLESWGVPSYLIINGFLGKSYQDESKYATLINAFGESIRAHYFSGMDNVECLGDPRMDDYANCSSRVLNRERPTVVIGASGFNPTDLNSYVAVEFDFLWDVLETFRQVVADGCCVELVIKVRPNGYRAQYRSFVREYFPELQCCIEDETPMKSVLEASDFYISIYSQTLFEASCLGVPAVYYKKDNEITDPPFDGASELVTVSTREELRVAFDAFRRGEPWFDAFRSAAIMEKYIGPLDGRSTIRNLNSIYRQLGMDVHTYC